MNYQLHRGDCLEIMPTLPAGSIDAIICDPPYGLGHCNRSDGGGVLSAKSGNKIYKRSEWDSVPAKPEAIRMILDFGVPTAIWGGNYFSLPATECLLIWNKCQRNFSLADAEICWTNLDRATRIFDYSRGEAAQENRVHPTQKPIKLIRWVLEQMRLPIGATIADPYMGSGTTGIACAELGFNFIGIELDEAYFKIAQDRIESAYRKAQGLPRQGKVADFADMPLFA